MPPLRARRTNRREATLGAGCATLEARCTRRAARRQGRAACGIALAWCCWLVVCGGRAAAQGDLWSVAPRRMTPASDASRPSTVGRASQPVAQYGDGRPSTVGRVSQPVAQYGDGLGRPSYNGDGLGIAPRRDDQPAPPAAKRRPLARLQSPAAIVAGQFGQVPMGRTDPSASGWSPAHRFQSADEPPVVLAQYTAPGVAPGSQPNGNQPVYNVPRQPPIDEPLPPPPGAVPPGGYDSEGDLFGTTPVLGENDEQLPIAPIDVTVKETQTGRLMFGLGVNSNAGLIGNITIDEQNFDWRRWPRSWEDIRNATAFRGGGQQLRIEAMPGTVLSRYAISLREPYLFDTKINASVSGSYFNRYYQDWTEQRGGGRVGFGYQLTPDLSVNLSLGGENVKIFNPFVPTPPELARVLGNNTLYSTVLSFFHDTRDSAFLPTSGHRVGLNLEQAWGTFSFPRATISYRRYFLIRERPDGSGRHTLTIANDTGFTGSDTPIFENFFAGGFNSLRGFYFRGAEPLDNGVQVGGHFSFLNFVEYMFPLMADDSLRGVAFVDYGTVERTTEIKAEDFRVSPGLGIRVTIPALGPAPLALDFSSPIHHAPGDHIQNFAFSMGLTR